MLFSTLAYFVVALFLLVVIHESGHFLVAKLCGVKVLRFAFGFGRVIWAYKSNSGTEYALCLWPLGGYVKMLDEREGPVHRKDKKYAFNQQSIWKRILIVLAGPIFNLVFAFICLWAVAVMGVDSFAPIIKSVTSDSPAMIAGIQPKDEIIAIDAVPVNSWISVLYQLLPHVTQDASMTWTLKNNEKLRDVVIKLPPNFASNKEIEPIKALGLIPFIPEVPAVVGEILPDSPASHALFKTGDKIIALDDKQVSEWMAVVNYVRAHPETLINVQVNRQGQNIKLELITGRSIENNAAFGYAGMRAQKVIWPKQYIRHEAHNFSQGASFAANQTVGLSIATMQMMGKLFLGQLNLNNLSGPVGIASSAGESGRSGLVTYLSFLALISISLGVINLLPIPLLDGGHLMYYIVEIIFRRPLSLKLMMAANTIGLVVLVSLMALALSNDMMRLFGG